MVARVERAGFRAIELTRAYEQAPLYPRDKWLPKAASYLTSPAVGEQIRAVLAAENPDLIAVDHMFPVGQIEAARYGRPSVTVCHTCVWRALDTWRKFIAMVVGLRSEAGFEPIPSDLESLWMIQDRMVVTTLAALDQPTGVLGNAHKLRYVGPVLEREPHATSVALPWPNGTSIPLVLVSFSTAPEQGSATKFQNAIDALAGLPVHGVVTVGDSLDPAKLRPADNVVVLGTADHDALMRRASVVLTHGGHGTFMRALKHGLPVVVVPGLAGDQPINAAAAEAWGVGRSLPRGESDPATMRTAIQQVLRSAEYRQRAQAIARDLAAVDGARDGADEIERLLPRLDVAAGVMSQSNGR